MVTLVTGGTGLLGSQIVRSLAENGEKPVAYDISPKPSLLSDISEKVKIVAGDATQLPDLVGTIRREGVDTLVHTAALLTVACEANPYKAYKTNLESTVQVAEAARLCDVKRVVYTSSGAVYGHASPKENMREDYPTRPVNYYGLTKLASEGFGSLYAKTYGFTFVALRLGGVLYGPGYMGSKATIVIREPIEKALKGETAKIPVPPETKYRFLYAKDAARAHFLALRRPSPKPVYNIGATQVAMREITSALNRIVEGDFITLVSGSSEELKRYTMTYDHAVPDDTLAKTDLGYASSYSIDQGLRETFDWFRAQHS